MRDDQILGLVEGEYREFRVTLSTERGVRPEEEDAELQKAFTGIYAIMLDEPVPRAGGKASNILYIGRTKDRRRLNEMIRGEHSVSPALRQLLNARDVRELAGSLLRITCVDPVIAEMRALRAYAGRYGELPPLNKRDEGYVSGELGRRIARALRQWHDVGWTWGGEWEVATHAAYVVDVHVRAGDGLRAASLHIVYPQHVQAAWGHEAVAYAGRVALWIRGDGADWQGQPAATASADGFFSAEDQHLEVIIHAIRGLDQESAESLETRLLTFVRGLPDGR